MRAILLITAMVLGVRDRAGWQSVVGERQEALCHGGICDHGMTDESRGAKISETTTSAATAATTETPAAGGLAEDMLNGRCARRTEGETPAAEHRMRSRQSASLKEDRVSAGGSGRTSATGPKGASSANCIGTGFIGKKTASQCLRLRGAKATRKRDPYRILDCNGPFVLAMTPGGGKLSLRGRSSNRNRLLRCPMARLLTAGTFQILDHHRVAFWRGFQQGLRLSSAACLQRRP